MTDVTVKAVDPATKQWTSKAGRNFTAYNTLLQLPDGSVETAEWSRPEDSEPPEIGATVSGEFSDSQFGKKFRLAAAGGGGYGGKPSDPGRTAAIQRQHSQEMALRMLSIGAIMLPEDEATLLGKVKSLTDWFERDISSTAPSGGGGSGATQGSPATSVHSEQVLPTAVTTLNREVQALGIKDSDVLQKLFDFGISGFTSVPSAIGALGNDPAKFNAFEEWVASIKHFEQTAPADDSIPF